MVYFYLFLGLALLLVSAKFLVDGASSIAAKLGLSAGLIGLTVVAFGTSAPELLVSVTAALKGTSDIAIGNVIGSNISNITLVLGISALLFPIVFPKTVIKLDYTFTLLTTLLFYGLAYNGIISLIEGIVLVILFVLVNLYFFKKIKNTDPELSPEDAEKLKKAPLAKAIILVLIGIVGLYFGSDLAVESAVEIAQIYGISERVIGVTIIAIGTSLPELATSVLAALKKETDLALGNILGSNLMNVLSIIGITAIVKPIEVSDLFLQTDFLWMIGFTIILFPIMLTGLKISRLEGGLLLVGYGLYLYFLL
ncbi:calcium/sodium antiporter [Pararhodonellum marinum]|uniref:calcium/sodium antiporter n=1 Tax=Pararhodonellum marinum TaxID=2755358 RepID=UPI0018909215|nr:calcium/sodium antiporter [Pararhodonellum marinum]